jgi:biopolymer transport protein ExbD
MKQNRRRRRRGNDQVDLDVTPFMNLMIVLVPVLLLSMVFVHTTVIDLNFPSGEAAAQLDIESVHLEVQVYDNEIIVADGRSIIKRITREDSHHDFGILSLTLQELKRRLPEKRDASILLQDQTDYQTLVSVMDTVRAYRVTQGDDIVPVELFPDVSLGDVPVRNTLASIADVSGGV